MIEFFGFLFICLITPLLLLLGSLIYAFSLGVKAWQRAQTYSDEASSTFRFITVNLCEPLANTLLIAWLLFSFLSTFNSISVLVSFFITLPMAILLLPLRGIHFQNSVYRRVNKELVVLGVTRWVLNFCIIASIALVFNSVVDGSLLILTVALVLPLAIAVYVASITLGRNCLNGSYAPVFMVTPSQQTPSSTIAPSPSTTSGTPTTQLQLPDLSTAIWCPVCHTPTALDADHCHLCGLVFTSRLPNDLLIPAPYTLLRPLATGGMSHVYLARDTTTDQLVVLKTLASIDAPQPTDWHTDAHTCLTHEATLLQSLDHPGLPHVHTWLPDDHTPLLVLEHIAGPTLEQTITVTDSTGQLVGTQPLPVADALGYAHGIAQTLVYLADQPQPIIHGDLKPANLIAATNRPIPVLLDFGSATRPEGDYPITLPQRYGTPGFAAPEQYHGQVTPTSDVYGLGVTLYQLLTADDPSTHPLQFPALATLPPDLADLLTSMLDRDPDRRPTPSALEVQLHQLIANRNHGRQVPIPKRVGIGN